MEQETHRQIFRQYYRLVYTIVQGRLGSVARHEDVEECVSDVFAEVFCKYEDSAYPGELKSYIRLVAVRRSIDLFRQLAPKAGRDIPLDEIGDMPDENSTAGDAERAETRRILMQCIRSLGQPDAAIIVQKYWFGASSSQIARGLALTPSAVRKRANKALTRLKAALKAHGIEEGAL